MARTKPFDLFYQRYEEWFEKNKTIYRLELAAVSKALPHGPSKSIEIGVGTGRFSLPLGITLGIEPSINMARIAFRRGIKVALGEGEELPLRSECFDCALMITTICFLDDPLRALLEMKRILKSGGRAIIGFVDKESELGKEYLKKRDTNPFYKYATFYSGNQVKTLLSKAGFENIGALQTLLPPCYKDKTIAKGIGEGGFVVMWGEKIS